MKKWLAVLVVGGVILAGLLVRPGRELVTRNRLSLEALKAAGSGDAARMLQVVGELEEKAKEHCAYYWPAGRLGQLSGALASNTNAAFTELIKCSGTYLHLVYVTNPTNRDLAEMAVELDPMSADAVFWLAEIVEKDDTLTAAALYERSINLDPTDGLAWCRLGRLRRDAGDLEGALLSLEQCCWNGDPGSNGCWGAGGVYEQLDNIPAAIKTYRMSRWTTAQNRADELEKSLKP